MSKLRKIHRILIYRIGNLGDIICAMPAMVAVRQHFPGAWIGLLTNKETKGNPDPEEILKGNNFLDEIITYETEEIRGFRYLREFLKKLHSFRIDLLVYLSISKSTHKRLIRDWLFFHLAGCRKLIGFKLPKYINTYKKNGIKMLIFPQEVDRLMSLLTPLGIDTSKVDFRLPINDKNRKFVDKLWDQNNLESENPVIAICPSAKFLAKRWSVERFGELTCELQRKFNAKIVLIGGLDVKACSKEIQMKSLNMVVSLIGKTNYMQSAEAISRCDLLVSNDCGPVHLAAAVKTPVVGIYSSRDYPRAWHPWGDIHTVLRNDYIHCRFCFKTECESKECINSITVEKVVQACQKYL